MVGRDTRRSGPLLQAAFSAGLAAEGADVVDLGVLPTPGVAAVAVQRKAPGAVISASHNPFGDNGIKLFSLLGTKLPTDVEGEIERELEVDPVGSGAAAPPSHRTRCGGRSPSIRDAVAHYEDHLVDTIEGRRLDGLRVVIDCANGAASVVAPAVLAELGAAVTALHVTPDGANINDKCGSTDPAELARAVVAHEADLGLAFDGDADRVIAVDQSGSVVDGDVLLALFALDLAERGRLSGNTVAVTVMTNLGFRLAMEARGIAVRETDVGDRHVLAALDADGLSLGRRAVGTHHLPVAVDDRRRHPHRHRAGRPRPARRPLPGRVVGRAGGAGAPAPRQRPHSPARAPGRAAPRSGRRWSRRRPSSVTTAVCCCGRAAPSRSCASWSRRVLEAQATTIAARLAGVVAAALGQVEPQAPR